MQTQIFADDKLKAALELYMENQLAKLPPDDELAAIEIPPQFEKKMNKLIRFHRRPYYPMVNTVGKRVAAIFIAAFLALTTTVFSVKALRDPTIHFFIEVYEKFSRIIFQNNDTEKSAPNQIKEYFTPQYLPDGFELVSTEKYDIVAVYKYCDSAGRDISYDQTILDGTNMIIDTEDTATEDVKINNMSGVYYSNKGYDNIIWNDGVYVFSLSAPSECGKDALLRMAESVK